MNREDLEVVIGPTVELSDQFYDRLSDFYISQKGIAKVSHIWDDIFNMFQKRIDEALISKDAGRIKESLGNMYDDLTLFGVDIAKDVLNTRFKYEQMWIDALTALANNVGVLNVYNPEQPLIEAENVEKVIRDIEVQLSCDINRTGGGGMFGVNVERRFIPHHLLEAFGIAASADRYFKHFCVQPENILEIGAGVGNLCLAMRKMYPDAQYHIVDLPMMHVIHSYLLAIYFGEDDIWFTGEPLDHMYDKKIFIHGVEQSQFFRDLEFGFAINQDSLPEIPMQSAIKYVEMIERQLKKNGLFLSINHESARGGQINVNKLIETETALSLVHRVPYWGRAGYLEELWQKVGE